MNYYDRSEISHSDLKLIDISIYKYLNREDVSTDAMKFGTMFHTYILENELFAKDYVIENIDGRTKEGKARKLIIESELKQVCSTEQFQLISEMGTAIKKLPLQLIDFDFEHSVEREVYFEILDVKCRSKIDFIDYDHKRIVDLKTIDDITKSFNKAKYDYGTQLAFYKLGIEQIYGGDWETWILFVEKNKPCQAVNLQIIDTSYYNDWIFSNLDKYRKWFETKDERYELYENGIIYL